MICKKCGKHIDDDSKFCIFCGVEQIETIKYTRGKLEPFNKGDKWGLKDIDTRDIIVQAKYTYIGLFVNDKAIVKGNNKFGFIDKNGVQITKLKYDSVQEFINGFAIVEYAEKFSFINENGMEITHFKYDKVYEFVNGFARVICDERYSFINQEGNEITPFHYNYVENFNKGYAKVRKGGNYHWGIINEKGKEILPCKYSIMNDFIDGITLIQNANGRWGVVNDKGTIIIPVKFKIKKIKLFDNDNGEIAVKKGKNWKCYNNEGKIISQPSEEFNKFKAIKRRKNRIIFWLIIFFIFIAIIALEATNQQGLTRTLILGKDEITWRYAFNKSYSQDTRLLKKYLMEYSDGNHIQEAKKRIEELVWKDDIWANPSHRYENYLKKYPNGKYSEEAKEIYEWKNAERINTIALYRNHLFKYPKSKNRDLAETKIINIQKANEIKKRKETKKTNSRIINIALSLNGGKATASSYGSYSGYTATPSKAIDGNTKTSWHGTVVPCWYMVEFNKEYNVEAIELYISYHSQTINVELSSNGKNWERVVYSYKSKDTKKNGQDDSEYKSFEITPTYAKYIKVIFTDTDAPYSHIYQCGLKELGVYARINY